MSIFRFFHMQGTLALSTWYVLSFLISWRFTAVHITFRRLFTRPEMQTNGRQHMTARRRSYVDAVLLYKRALKEKMNFEYLLYTKQVISNA